MTITEQLQAMRERLLEHGWTQHTLVNSDGKRCLVGAALDDAQTVEPACDMSKTELWEQFGDLLAFVADGIPADWISDQGTPDPFDVITSWNDEDSRQFAEVIDLLDERILTAKAMEA